MKNNFYASTNQSYYDELTSATSTNSLQAIRRVAGLSALFGLQKIFSVHLTQFSITNKPQSNSSERMIACLVINYWNIA